MVTGLWISDAGGASCRLAARLRQGTGGSHKAFAFVRRFNSRTRWVRGFVLIDRADSTFGGHIGGRLPNVHGE